MSPKPIQQRWETVPVHKPAQPSSHSEQPGQLLLA